jgi:cytidine deaminase
MDDLAAAAESARAGAYAPYSRLKIGAALLARDGSIFTGANIENASYGLTVCAERVALWSAVSHGAREFVALVVAGPKRAAAPPCGACRQVLAEFSPDLVVRYRGAAGRWTSRRLRALLPAAFALPPR